MNNEVNIEQIKNGINIRGNDSEGNEIFIYIPDNQIIPDYRGNYDEQKTVKEAREDGSITAFTTGILRGTVYYD